MDSVVRTDVPGLFIDDSAQSILEQIDSSVLIVKPPGFATLVRTMPCVDH